MDNFVYIAHDLAGREQRGLKRGVSQYDVYAWLHEHGLIPIEVKPAKAKTKKISIAAYHKPKPGEIAGFCWQLATMVEGGVLITEAIDIVLEDIENQSFRKTLQEISNQVKSGETLASSVQHFPSVFDKLFYSMILAGETSGALPTVLRRMAEYYDNREKFNRKLKAALAYPVFVLSFVLLILVIMVAFIIPRFRTIFDQMGNMLPKFTQIFLGIYDLVANNFLYVALGVLSMLVLLWAYNRTIEGHEKICKMFLTLPLLGKLNTQAFVATFCKTMATLLGAGVSIIESFDILSEMSGNKVIREAVLSSKDRLIQGSSISAAVQASGFFPPMVTRMIQVGEKSGSLSGVLNRAADYYETKMDATITTLLNLLGPMVIILVGGMVMVIVIALYLPIFSMSDFNVGTV